MAITSLSADPCARAEQLRAIRDNIITGGQPIEVEHQAGNGQHRRVKYSPANLSALETEIDIAASACALGAGGRPTRFAIGGRL
jgi:hypothetical protein